MHFWTNCRFGFGVGLLSCLVIACGAGSKKRIYSDDVPSVGVSGRAVKTFNHELHLSEDVLDVPGSAAYDKDGLNCQDCHNVDLEAGYQTIRPGSDEHKPCRDCHRDAFDKPPGDFCKTCHDSINIFEEGKSPLHSYPSKYKRVALVSAYNHAQHLAAANREESGAGLNCEDCHKIEEDGAFAEFPVHGNCFGCHEKAVAPRMNDCSGCHERDGFGRHRKFLCNDIRFTHAKHRVTAEGKKLECNFCHVDIEDSEDSEDLNLPQMYDCSQCHDQAAKTPDRVRIDNCGLCHQDTVDADDLPSSHTGESRLDRAMTRCL